LANGLLWLDKRNREATLQDRVNAIFALIDSRSLAQLPARKNADIERVATAVFEVRQAVAADAPSTRKPRFRAAHLLLRFLRDQRSSHCTPPRGSGSGFSPISKFALTSGTRSRDCRSFILWIKHISLAIDNLFCVIGTLMQERPSASISLMACGSAGPAWCWQTSGHYAIA